MHQPICFVLAFTSLTRLPLPVSATAAAVLFLKGFFFIMYNIALKFVLYAVFVRRHRRRVKDALFQVESARFLTAPTPLQMLAFSDWLLYEQRRQQALQAAQEAEAAAAAAAANGGAGAGAMPTKPVTAAVEVPPSLPPPVDLEQEAFVALRRRGSPTNLLDSDQFWRQLGESPVQQTTARLQLLPSTISPSCSCSPAFMRAFHCLCLCPLQTTSSRTPSRCTRRAASCATRRTRRRSRNSPTPHSTGEWRVTPHGGAFFGFAWGGAHACTLIIVHLLSLRLRLPSPRSIAHPLSRGLKRPPIACSLYAEKLMKRRKEIKQRMLDVLVEDDLRKAVVEAELEAAFAADAVEASRRASMLEGGPGGWSPPSIRIGQPAAAFGAGVTAAIGSPNGPSDSLAVSIAKQASQARRQLDSVNPARDGSFVDAEEQYYRTRGGISGSSTTTYRGASQPPVIVVPLDGPQSAGSSASSAAPASAVGPGGATSAVSSAVGAVSTASSAVSGASVAGRRATVETSRSGRGTGGSDVASASTGTASSTSLAADGSVAAGGGADEKGTGLGGNSRSGRRSDMSETGRAAAATAGHGPSSSAGSASAAAAAAAAHANSPHGFLPAIGAAVRDIFVGTEVRGRPRRTVAGRASAAAANRGEAGLLPGDDDIAAQLGLVEGKSKPPTGAGSTSGAAAAGGLPPATTLDAPFGKADGSALMAATAAGGSGSSATGAAMRPPRSRSLELEAANMASRGRRSGADLAAAARSIAAGNNSGAAAAGGSGSVAAARGGIASGGAAGAGKSRPGIATSAAAGGSAAAAPASGAMSPPMQDAAKAVANFVVRRMRARLARQRAAATGIAGGDDDSEDGSSPGDGAGDSTPGSTRSQEGTHRAHGRDARGNRHDDDSSIGVLSPSTASGAGSAARRSLSLQHGRSRTLTTGSGASGASGSAAGASAAGGNGPLSAATAVTAVSDVSVTSVAGSAASSAVSSAAAGGGKAGAKAGGAPRRGNRSFFPLPNPNGTAIRLPRKAGDGIADGEAAVASFDGADDADAAASASDGDLIYDAVDDDDDDALSADDDGNGSESAGSGNGGGDAGAVDGLAIVPQGPLVLRVPLDPNDFYGTPRARSFAGISDKPDVTRWQLMSCALFKQNTEVREQSPLPNGQPLIIRFVMRAPLPPPPSLPPGMYPDGVPADALADPAFAAAAAAYEAAVQQRAVAESAEDEGGPYVDEVMLRRLPSVAAMGKLLRLEAELCALSNAAPGLSLPDIEPCFTSRGDAALAYRLLDQDGDGAVVRDEFASAMVLMYSFWASSQSAVANFGGVSGAIALLVNIVRWIISIIIVLSIFDLSFSAAWAYVSWRRRSCAVLLLLSNFGSPRVLLQLS